MHHRPGSGLTHASPPQRRRAQDPEDKATEIESALENYPVLNDEDHSDRETTATEEYWDQCLNTGDRVEYLQKEGESIFAARCDGADLYHRAPDTFYTVQSHAVE